MVLFYQIGKTGLFMRLLGQSRLLAINHLGEDIQKWICGWVAEVKHAHWKHSSQILEQFPSSANEISRGDFEFFIAEQPISIRLSINFAQSIAVINEVKVRDEF